MMLRRLVSYGVVEPTPLKNMNVKLDHETPRFGVKIPKIFELPPARVSYGLVLLYGVWRSSFKSE